LSTDVHVRDATPADMAAVGQIRLAAYRSGGFLATDSPYAEHLRDLGTRADGNVLVAVRPATSLAGSGDSDSDDGGIIGTIMLQPWPLGGPVAVGAGEAEIRALAVVPGAQRAGIGQALLDAVIDRAVATAVQHLVLSTQPDMQAAHRLYERAGFLRLPDRDWSPRPGLTLLAYGLRLPGTR
jgi:ribosomal protein S18 acetylase RimI-like enzyme